MDESRGEDLEWIMFSHDHAGRDSADICRQLGRPPERGPDAQDTARRIRDSDGRSVGPDAETVQGGVREVCTAAKERVQKLQGSNVDS